MTSTAPVLSSSELEKKVESLLPENNRRDNWLKNLLLNCVSNKKNAHIICDYVIAMRQEVNIAASTRRNLIAILCRFIRVFDNGKKSFRDITKNDMLLHLQSLR